MRRNYIICHGGKLKFSPIVSSNISFRMLQAASDLEVVADGMIWQITEASATSEQDGTLIAIAVEDYNLTNDMKCFSTGVSRF